MVPHLDPTISLSTLIQDSLGVAGVFLALTAGILFLNLGLLLPGLLTALGEPGASSRQAFPEAGPVAFPVISEPTPRGALPAPTAARTPVPRPHIWRMLAGSATPNGAAFPVGSLPRA